MSGIADHADHPTATDNQSVVVATVAAVRNRSPHCGPVADHPAPIADQPAEPPPVDPWQVEADGPAEPAKPPAPAAPESDAFALALAAHADLIETAPGVWTAPGVDLAWLDGGITRAEMAEVLDFNRQYRGNRP